MSNQQDVVKELNQQVANWTVAYTKLHNFHWYVKGPNFFSLHVKFEELSQDFTNISKQLENAIEIAGNAGDDVSEDMFIGMQTSVDKHNWMFKSYLS